MSGSRPPITIVSGSDPAWESSLTRVARDVYHTQGYHQYEAGSGGGGPFLAVVGDAERGLAWPYLLRSLEGIEGIEGEDGTDVTSVYGYPGPIAWGCEPGDPFIGMAWSAIVEAWRDQGAIAAFTRFHPLLDNAALARHFLLPGDGDGPEIHLSAGTPTVSIDCRIPDEEARRGYVRVLRQEIAAARRAGLESELDTEWTHVDTFIELYTSTMARSGADDRYLLTTGDVRRFQAAVAPHAHLIVTRRGDTVAAVGLFTEFDGIVQAHLVGTNVDLRSLSPLKVHLDDARRWAHERGDHVLHLGGGRGGTADSLLSFKGRFSARRHSFHTGRWIIRPERYAALSRLHAKAIGGDLATDFFPAYRAPVTRT